MKKLFVFILLFFSFISMFAVIEPSGLLGWKKANNTCVLPTFVQLKSIENNINQQLFYWTSDCEGCFYNQGELDRTMASSFKKYYICWDSLNYSGKTSQTDILQWSSRSHGPMSWKDAIAYCRGLREGGYNDWKLPNIDELRTTIKNCFKTEHGGLCKISEKNGCLSGKRCGNGYISESCYCDYKKNAGGYYSKLGDDDQVVLWSSSVRSDDSSCIWVVSFIDGAVTCLSPVISSGYVRCVRSLTSAVETNEVINVDLTTATLSATVISIGDPAYSERGFVYSKHQNPTTLDNKVVVSGSGAGTYTWNLSGRETRVTYYVKAYVISNNDVIYGNEVSFYTESPYYYVLSDDLIVAREDVGEAGWYSAFDLCSNSRLGGFNDWRLPTIDELVTVYNNLESIGNFTYDVVYGPYESEEYVALYLSSSEYDEVEDAILVLDFIDGAMGYAYKTDVLHVRCVR